MRHILRNVKPLCVALQTCTHCVFDLQQMPGWVVWLYWISKSPITLSLLHTLPIDDLPLSIPM